MNRLELETGAWVERFTPPPRCQSWTRALRVIAHSIGRDGRTPNLAHARLARMIGLEPRQTQNVVHALARAGVLKIDARRGFANVYRVLVDWVLRLIAGESVAELAVPVTAEPDAQTGAWSASAPTHPPPIYGRWVFSNGACIHAAEACDECLAKQQ